MSLSEYREFNKKIIQFSEAVSGIENALSSMRGSSLYGKLIFILKKQIISYDSEKNIEVKEVTPKGLQTLYQLLFIENQLQGFDLYLLQSSYLLKQSASTSYLRALARRLQLESATVINLPQTHVGNTHRDPQRRQDFLLWLQAQESNYDNHSWLHLLYRCLLHESPESEDILFLLDVLSYIGNSNVTSEFVGFSDSKHFSKSNYFEIMTNLLTSKSKGLMRVCVNLHTFHRGVEKKINEKKEDEERISEEKTKELSSLNQELKSRDKLIYQQKIEIDELLVRLQDMEQSLGKQFSAKQNLEKNLSTWHDQEKGATRQRLKELVELYVDPALRFIDRGKPQGAEMLLENLRHQLMEI